MVTVTRSVCMDCEAGLGVKVTIVLRRRLPRYQVSHGFCPRCLEKRIAPIRARRATAAAA